VPASDVATSTEPRSYRHRRIEALGGTLALEGHVCDDAATIA